MQPDALSGNFAPVTEERVLLEPACTGTLPTGLDGLYVRTGPNPLPDSPPRPLPWLTGDGMVHGLRIEGGRVLWYRNRWISTPEVADRLGRSAPVPPPALVPEGSGNLAVCPHAGNLYAFSELALPYALSTGTLETRAIEDFGGPLPAGSIGHPKADAATGALHTLAYHFEAPYLRHHEVDRRGRLVRSRVLPLERPAYVHDFGLGRRWLVLFDLPRLFSEEALLDGQPLPYCWTEDAEARVGLVPRDGDGPPLWFPTDPFRLEHVAAVHEESSGRVVVDLIAGPAEDGTDATLQRLTLDPGRGVCLREVLDDRPQDLPTGDPRTATGGRRWLWTLAADRSGPAPVGRRLYRHDLLHGERVEVPLPDGVVAGELSYVPAHARAEEDEGWLLGFCWEGPRSVPGFLVLDARRPGAEPVARITLTGRVPHGSHGCWMALPRGSG